MPSLYRYIWYQVGDQMQAEELTAAVCERALHILDRYDPTRGSFKAWMFGIARNEVRHVRRSQVRQPVTLSLDELPDLPTESPSVEQTFRRREMQHALMRHLYTLPELERDLIALRYGGGFTNREIADLTGLTESNVAVKLHRTLKKLRAALEADRTVPSERE
jgi:RNA polymerase sigma factor (sigma-70 family)